MEKKTKNRCIPIMEFGEIVGCSRQTVRRWILEGKIDGWRVGRDWRTWLSEAYRIIDETANLPGTANQVWEI